MELLRFTTAGSVDDGKSTLIGRLLYDSRGAYEDQIAALRILGGDGIDLSLLTDGLRAEREQGITIDVAYRYFNTPRRKFIIADTPGHEQYTRNMATGASTAHLAVILVDARYGVLPQSRRHAFIAHLLGIPRLVVAVNKMDLVDYRREIFDAIRAEFSDFIARLGAPAPYYIPVSALRGDNVVSRSAAMPWYDGESLLRYLEEVPAAAAAPAGGMRLPVQYVIRPNQDFRGYAGQVASGSVRTGDEVVALPSGRRSRVKSIVTWEGELAAAYAPMSVTVTLEDEIDVSRGDMLASPAHPPHVSRRFTANLVWMSEKPLVPHRSYFLKHTTRQVRAIVRNIRYRADVNTLAHHPAETLELNEIGSVAVETQQPLAFDAYRSNRVTGSFILIDPQTNETAGAGMIEGPAEEEARGRVAAKERAARYGHPGALIWLSATTETAWRLERELFDDGCAVCVTEHAADALAARDAGLIAICTAQGPPPRELTGMVIELNDENAYHAHIRGLIDAHMDEVSDGAGI